MTSARRRSRAGCGCASRRRALIAGLSGAATATIALNEVETSWRRDLQLYRSSRKAIVKPEYTGGPQTFLVLGSDRRAKSKDALDRSNPPHSDTLLLVRFDPGQGQTSVLSIPRDLLVNIKTPKASYYPQEKINAAYTIGSQARRRAKARWNWRRKRSRTKCSPGW